MLVYSIKLGWYNENIARIANNCPENISSVVGVFSCFTERCHYNYYCHYCNCQNVTSWVLSSLYFSSFITIYVFYVLSQFEFQFFLLHFFLVLFQFVFFSLDTIWVFESCHNLNFKFCHNLSFSVLFKFDFFLALSWFEFF